jgi:hypothetical protein
MRFRVVGFALMIGVAGCAQNAAKMARNADPRVCAASDVKDVLFSILKQNGHIPDGDVNNTGVMGKDLLSAISMTISDVASKSVDKDAQEVDCSATVHLMTKGVQGTVDGIVDYAVKPDQSDDSKILVSATENGSISFIEQAAGSLLNAKLADQAAAKKKQFAIDHPAAADDPALSENIFMDDEKALIVKEDDLNDQCRGSHPEACDARDAVFQQLKAKGICYGPDAAIEADKHWMHCTYIAPGDSAANDPQAATQ